MISINPEAFMFRVSFDQYVFYYLILCLKSVDIKITNTIISATRILNKIPTGRSILIPLINFTTPIMKMNNMKYKEVAESFSLKGFKQKTEM